MPTPHIDSLEAPRPVVSPSIVSKPEPRETGKSDPDTKTEAAERSALVWCAHW
jgi:hypothetical protein